MSNLEPIKILLAGDGGQGVQTIADIICKAVFENNKHVTHIPNYGLEQRGGASLAFIQISSRGITYPKFAKPDILLIMSDQARARTEEYQTEAGKIFDIKDYLDEINGDGVKTRSQNIFFLGLICKILEFDGLLKTDEALMILAGRLKSRPGWEENEKAFMAGKNLAVI